MTRRRLFIALCVGTLVGACRGGSTPAFGEPDAATNDDASTSSSSGGTGGDGDAGEPCSLPKQAGPCEAEVRRFWFDSSTGKCAAFTYGGCAGNANNFETAEACIAACAPDASADPCQAITCLQGNVCVYAVATPVCTEPCADDAGACSQPQHTCQCAGSCPSCKDCVMACLP